MCSGCPGNYEDSEWPDRDDPEGPEFGPATIAADYEVLVSADSIIEIRCTPANVWSFRGLQPSASGPTRGETAPVSKQSASVTAKRYRTQRDAAAFASPNAKLAIKPLVFIVLAALSIGFLAGWLFFA
jgi:hypothetical protein